jgi:CheY-like chemotaxis protein
MLAFEVTDTGMGIPEKDLPFIFDRFRQVDGSASRARQGTGIGLALTRELVTLMGGTISVRSGAEGTCMTFSIPYEPAERSGSEQRPAAAGGAGDRLSRIRILAADDDPAGRETLAFLLADSYDIIFANDGNEAVRLFGEKKPGLVLMDIVMPGLDGFGALKKIRALPGGGSVPVVAVTARAMKGERERILGAGFDGYISKPIDGDNLIGAIEAAVSECGGDNGKEK